VIGAAAEFTLNGPALHRDQIGAATQAKALLEMLQRSRPTGQGEASSIANCNPCCCKFAGKVRAAPTTTLLGMPIRTLKGKTSKTCGDQHHRATINGRLPNPLAKRFPRQSEPVQKMSYLTLVDDLGRGIGLRV
jgi:hypothetical protein